MDTISFQRNEFQIFLQQFKELASNKIYIFATMGLCSVYFVVTGIQFWTTSYLIKVLNQDPKKVTLFYALCSITAPIPGAATGGYITDRSGGYRGKNVMRAIRICFCFGFLAFCLSVPLGLVQDLFYFILLLWGLLFFGAAIIPIATGIIVSSAGKDH